MHLLQFTFVIDMTLLVISPTFLILHGGNTKFWKLGDQGQNFQADVFSIGTSRVWPLFCPIGCREDLPRVETGVWHGPISGTPTMKEVTTTIVAIYCADLGFLSAHIFFGMIS